MVGAIEIVLRFEIGRKEKVGSATALESRGGTAVDGIGRLELVLSILDLILSSGSLLLPLELLLLLLLLLVSESESRRLIFWNLRFRLSFPESRLSSEFVSGLLNL